MPQLNTGTLKGHCENVLGRLNDIDHARNWSEIKRSKKTYRRIDTITMSKSQSRPYTITERVLRAGGKILQKTSD